MKTKPILFNTEMVRAILEGRKTVTRRVLKDPWYIDDEEMSRVSGFAIHRGTSMTDGMPYPDQPYHPGEILYVRETFRVDYLSNIPSTGRIQYKADGLYRDFSFAPARYDMMRRAQLKPGWRPNENMPREAARIFLRVTDVRVERLQDITPEQAMKEGVIDQKNRPYIQYEQVGQLEWYARNRAFPEIWDSTIKPADRALYGWDVNPWCWVIEFERISKENVNDEQTD